MIVANINSRYQITIPKKLRAVFHLAVGDVLHCRSSEGTLILSPKIGGDEDESIAITVRDRFQITLPVKKLRARSSFTDPIVRIEQHGNEWLTILPNIPLDGKPSLAPGPAINTANLGSVELGAVGTPRRKRKSS